MARGPDPPAITLLTDFGLRDTYVGVMKAVILSRQPRAVVVDLTHEVEPGNIDGAAFLLATAWTYFPIDSTHVAVVDPGVGSGRRVLAARVRGHHLLAPDNGLLSAVFDMCEPEQVVSVERTDLFLDPVSATFHGRDIFAPVAAALSRGADLGSLGPTIRDWRRRSAWRASRDPDGRMAGQVVHIDRFGNLITSLRGSDLPGPGCRIQVAGRAIDGLSSHYAAVPEGGLLAIVGSAGFMEISINRGNAAATLKASVGDRIHVQSPGRGRAS